jgi:thiol-disulfide isomerase/thioredoxin
MKKLIISVAAILITGISGIIISCDKVKEPYMKEVDVSDCPVPVFPDTAVSKKTVLIEEFTGHLCPNCPTGAHVIDQIQQAYGNRVIVLKIHADQFAEPENGNFSLDLRAGDHGDELYTHFGTLGEPCSMFNRKKIDGTNIGYYSTTTWQNNVTNVLAMEPVLNMQIINDYDPTTRKLCSHIKTKFLNTNSQNLKIAVWIAEDSIRGYQINNNATLGPDPIPDYVFMDVMRDEFVGTYGEIFTSGSVAKDSTIIRTYKMILNNGWGDKHCKVVAYVYDVDSQEILQAVEGKIIE